MAETLLPTALANFHVFVHTLTHWPDHPPLAVLTNTST